MYRFKTQGGDEVALRPDNTAGFARAFISNGWQERLPVRGFRNRYFGTSVHRTLSPIHANRRGMLGVASPLQDVECIACGMDILSELGLRGCGSS